MGDVEPIAEPGALLVAFIPVILAANALTLMWCYGFWAVTRQERNGREPKLGAVLCLAIPPLVGAGALLIR